METKLDKKVMETKLDDEQYDPLENNVFGLIIVATVTALNSYYVAFNPPLAVVAGNNGVNLSMFVLFNTIGLLASYTVILILVTGSVNGSRFLYWLVKPLILLILTCMAITFTISTIANVATPHKASALMSNPQVQSS